MLTFRNVSVEVVAAFIRFCTIPLNSLVVGPLVFGESAVIFSVVAVIFLPCSFLLESAVAQEYRCRVRLSKIYTLNVGLSILCSIGAMLYLFFVLGPSVGVALYILSQGLDRYFGFCRALMVCSGDVLKVRLGHLSAAVTALAFWFFAFIFEWQQSVDLMATAVASSLVAGWMIHIGKSGRQLPKFCLTGLTELRGWLFSRHLSEIVGFAMTNYGVWIAIWLFDTNEVGVFRKMQGLVDQAKGLLMGVMGYWVTRKVAVQQDITRFFSTVALFTLLLASVAFGLVFEGMLEFSVSALLGDKWTVVEDYVLILVLGSILGAAADLIRKYTISTKNIKNVILNQFFCLSAYSFLCVFIWGFGAGFSVFVVVFFSSRVVDWMIFRFLLFKTAS